jgi:hypothetical protein
MSFKITAVITAIVTFVLGVVYLFAGSLAIGRWQIEPTESLLLFGRRLGALYLGLSIIFFLVRSATASDVRSALSIGTVVVCSLLAFLGIYEFSAGHAGPAILFSAAIESFLALCYIRIILAERKNNTGKE